MAQVIAYSEDPGMAAEAAAAAADVARSLGAGSLLLQVGGRDPSVRTGGRIVVAGSSPRGDAEFAASTIAQVARRLGFVAILIGETRFGTVVAARVAAKLGVGSLGRGKGLRSDGERLSVLRDAYGGKFAARVSSRLPCVALVQRGAYEPSAEGKASFEKLEVAEAKSRVRVLEERLARRATADIRSAKIVVSAGRGFDKKEDLALAQELADALGAALGCSRPLTAERGWMGEDQQIGLTGAYVHPDLYFAIGISGQLQHVAGVKDSKVIVAINRDRQAPIFQASDYGVVGDLYEVLPALTRALRAR